MGCQGLWRFFAAKKRYKPVFRKPRHQSEALGGPNSKIRVDVQACFFPTIRYAYANHGNQYEVAHAIVLKTLERSITDRTAAVLYFDGAQCEEKIPEQHKRQNARLKAIDNADKHVTTFEDHMAKGARLRKRHFANVKRQLTAAFRWSTEARDSLIHFLRTRGWEVVQCATEADVKIATDTEEGDIVISGDSDLFVYKQVAVVWRPLRGGGFLEYQKPAVLSALGLETTEQLTALGVVSTNDYNRSVFGLGCETNYKIVKAISAKGSDDAALGVPTLVEEYLSDERVILKNKTGLTFGTSISVFVTLKQTPLATGQYDNPNAADLETKLKNIKKRFEEACDQFKEQKQAQLASKAEDKRAASLSPPRRHRPSQKYNRYRTIDRPPPREDKDSTTALPPRPRYSAKTRRKTVEHDPPKSMKRYEWKKWTTKPKSNLETVKKEPTSEAPSTDIGDKMEVALVAKVNNKPKKKSKKSKKADDEPKEPLTIDQMNKRHLLAALKWEHPLVTLRIGTIQANIRAASKGRADVAREMMTCLQDAVREANRIKRQAQKIIALYIERIASGHLEPKDREFLDGLCKRVQPEDETESQEDDEEDVDDEDVEGDEGHSGGEGGTGNKKTLDIQQQFIGCFLRYLYSGKLPMNRGVGILVNRFILKLQELGLHIPTAQIPSFTPGALVRSVSGQLVSEINRVFRRGTVELKKQLANWQDSGRPEMAGIDLEIDFELTAVENFLRFNKISGCRRKIAPLSSAEDGFVTFSEIEIATFCWKRPVLKNRILEIVRSTFPTCSALADVTEAWLSGQAPGVLIMELIADIAPTGLTVRQRGKLGFRGAIDNMSMDDVRDHLAVVRDPSFDPRNYNRKGYLLAGSIRTDGLRLQLTGFKLKELQSVRYQRLSKAILPVRLTSTVGGTNYYLQEIRNVVKTKDDVARLWPNCPPNEIKVLCLDLGQAFVVAGSAFLPGSNDKKGKGPAVAPQITSTPWNIADTNFASSLMDIPYPETFYNMSVNQKAVYQPAFKFRKWSEERKQRVPEGIHKSIQEIETSLPPLHGPDTSVAQYVQELEAVGKLLDDFYNGSNRLYKSHAWDAQRAKEEEYLMIANRLLKMIGGSIGAKRDAANMAVIGIGLGDFSSSARLTSLHNAFLAVFVPLARALGYIVVGVNEYYSSKKCPRCRSFVCQVTIRRLFCDGCGTYFHRDEMAAQNMVNAVRGHLLEQQRPLYLQPVDENGHYPWMEETEGVDESSKNNSTNNDMPPVVLDGIDPTEMGMDIWGSGYAMDFEDKADKVILADNSGASSSNCVRESDQDSFRRAPKRLASEEVDQIRAILRKALRLEE